MRHPNGHTRKKVLKWQLVKKHKPRVEQPIKGKDRRLQRKTDKARKFLHQKICARLYVTCLICFLIYIQRVRKMKTGFSAVCARTVSIQTVLIAHLMEVLFARIMILIRETNYRRHMSCSWCLNFMKNAWI